MGLGAEYGRVSEIDTGKINRGLAGIQKGGLGDRNK